MRAGVERGTGGAVVDAEMRDFMLVLRQALLMIVRYIEKKYKLGM